MLTFWSDMADYQFQPNIDEPVLQLREAMNRMDGDSSYPSCLET